MKWGTREATWQRPVGQGDASGGGWPLATPQVATGRWLRAEIKEKVAGGCGDPEGKARSRWRGVRVPKMEGEGLYIDKGARLGEFNPFRSRSISIGRPGAEGG